MRHARVLLIEYYEVAASALGVASTVAGPVPSGAKEPAGAAFHTTVLRQQGLLADPEPSSALDDEASGAGVGGPSRPSSSGGPSDADLQPPPGVSWKRSKSKRKGGDKRKRETDYYALLGLQNERWTATDAQIKLAYRRTCLEAHPDKALQGVEDPAEKVRVEERFKAIQEAYEVLSDTAKRREYDSTDEFDDTLPTGCDPSDFFKVFGPAFRRNARWSIDPAVPDVGGPDAPWAEVAAFYDFWFGFRSWREFPHPDEEDVEGAESREHRRWIERLNAKLREKGKKEEAKRLREFVDAAYRTDPRVATRREEERLERERKKAEKEEARRLQREEEERRHAESEARRQAEEEEAKRVAAEAKRLREAEKRALKKERQRLRALVEGGGGAGAGRLLGEDETEKLAQALDIAALAALCDAAGAEGLAAAQRRAMLEGALRDMRSAEEVAAEERERLKRETAAAMKDMAKRDHQRRMASMSAWTDEELRLLDKAMTKFPIGTPKRWEAVTAYVRTRPQDEVLLMVKERQGAAANRLRQQEDWKGAAKRRAEVKAEADLRCNAFTDIDVRVATAQDAGSEGGGADMGPGSSKASDGGGGTTGGASSMGGGITGGKGSDGGAPANCAASAAAAASNGAAPPAATAGGRGDSVGGAPKPKKVVSADSGEWSEAQELALVQGLRQFGKELPDRWERIAAMVEGKTKTQCFKRFKELKEAFKAKKTEA